MKRKPVVLTDLQRLYIDIRKRRGVEVANKTRGPSGKLFSKRFIAIYNKLARKHTVKTLEKVAFPRYIKKVPLPQSFKLSFPLLGFILTRKSHGVKAAEKECGPDIKSEFDELVKIYGVRALEKYIVGKSGQIRDEDEDPDPTPFTHSHQRTVKGVGPVLQNDAGEVSKPLYLTPKKKRGK